MQFKCHECDALYESHHTNYKHSQGYHPSDNPTHSKDVAAEKTHCLNCLALRSYDPVAARSRDLVAQSGMDTGLIGEFQGKIASLQAQIEEAKQQKAVQETMQEQISNLEKLLATLKPAAPIQATT